MELSARQVLPVMPLLYCSIYKPSEVMMYLANWLLNS